ncbi:MAG: hypothetical protein ACLP62_02585 [Acidimicrobiales bacterium]
MNPSLTSRMVEDRRREMQNLVATGRLGGRRARHRRSRPLSRWIGVALIRAGRRLAGPEDQLRAPVTLLKSR